MFIGCVSVFIFRCANVFVGCASVRSLSVFNRSASVHI